MEADKAIKERRAIRKFKDIDVSDSLVQELLDLARYAPSSMNDQPWHFIVIRNLETKKRMAELKNKYCPPEKEAYKADFLVTASVVVVVCVDQSKSHGREIENGVLAAANIILGAAGRGLGSTYMTAHTPEEPQVSEGIKRILSIPDGFHPIVLIPLGYPDEVPNSKNLKSLEEMIHHEKF